MMHGSAHKASHIPAGGLVSLSSLHCDQVLKWQDIAAVQLYLRTLTKSVQVALILPTIQYASTILKFSVVERLMIILSMGRHRLDATTTKFNQTDMAKLKMVSLHAFI